MTIAFLNGEYLPLEEARISPMDRGFLFGDGIYEVIPTLESKPVGLLAHLARMEQGLSALEIPVPFDNAGWQDIFNTLLAKNSDKLGTASVGIYLQVSRGTVMERAHAYPENITPTVFAYAFKTAAPPVPDKAAVKQFAVVTTEDKRWQRCNIKSTSLLGNVMHYQQSKVAGVQETILYNQHQNITEASSCNVFMVKNGVISTPPLDHQLLPGITRKLVIDSLALEGIAVNEAVFSVTDLKNADEVWLTSSSKEIAPVTAVDGKPVGNGEVGPVWQQAIEIFNRHKFQL